MHILIIGAGVGGEGIARYLTLQKIPYYFVDDDPKCKKRAFTAPHVVPWKEISQAVVSAGVYKSPWLKAVKAHSIPVVSEAQFALERLKTSRLVAVTGTNGKTTLVLFAEHVLRSLGYDAKACGNVGLSLGAFLSDPSDIGVVELSSFQLEYLDAKVFESAVVLDISADHLDRHGSMEEYVKIKAHLCNLVKPGGRAFVAEDTQAHFEVFFPSHAEPLDPALISATYALLSPFKIELKEICTALDSFKKPSHRLEEVASIDGVRFINDSKATNLSAVSYALSQLSGESVVLILSGMPKEPSIDRLDLSKVDHLIAFGDMRALVDERAHQVGNLEEAVSLAFDLARPKGVVLFSPGGSSFDCFENYIDRGNQFKYTVKRVQCPQ